MRGGMRIDDLEIGAAEPNVSILWIPKTWHLKIVDNAISRNITEPKGRNDFPSLSLWMTKTHLGKESPRKLYF